MTEQPQAGPGQSQAEVLAAFQQAARLIPALRQSVDDLKARMGMSEKDRARLHKISRRTIGGLVLDIALSLFVIFGIGKIDHQGASIAQLQATNRRLDATISQLHATATQFHANVVGSCVAFNVRLHQDAAVWDYVIGQSRIPSSATPAERRTEQRLLTHLHYLVDSKDAPRKCSALFSTHPAK